MDRELTDNEGYAELINNLKQKIQTAQNRAILSVNRELVILYWEIGKSILDKQEKEGWGTKIIDNLSMDLRKSFPDMKGFSVRNLKYMQKFAKTYSNFEIVQELLAQLTWYHNLTLMEKIQNFNERIWYLNKTIENGWSRNVLVHQIELKLYKRQVLEKKTTNFDLTLQKPQSDLAKEMLKDRYVFEFLTIDELAREKEIENQLTKHITKVLLELGAGFAFVGNQYHLEIAQNDYYIDLLFYHLKLRCYVAIELKTGDFKPEYAGKINFYLSVIDDVLKTKQDNPSIGILLCKTKNRIIAEYALRDMNKPIGVSEYKLIARIPDELKHILPTIEKLESELESGLKKVGTGNNMLPNKKMKV
ncbi:MAG: DUF1016 domain-containing protein [Candidatus Altiarchaeales archaeon HGW-Altiarchaeales-1]|nr:MAG: DUF1016 domain-containing protein [Candidatus Altiarchaeales archaeon HGW-Altiarchaeales-1]